MVHAMLAKEGIEYQQIHEEENICKLKNYSSMLVIDANTKALFPTIEDYKQYLFFVKQNGFTTIVFEEFTDDVFPSDMVIIPYLGAETLACPNKDSVKYLLGPEYFVFREEFIVSPKVNIKGTVKNIMVCMGGSDPLQLTEKVTGFFLNYPVPFHLTIVFAALDEERKEKLNAMLTSYAGSYEILVNPAAISAVMLASDLGVINSGLIKYETCVMGLPCISLSNNPEHEPLMELFAKKEMIRHLGIAASIDDKQFSDSLSSLINSKSERKRLSDNALKMFDGKGIERIFTAIENLKN